MSLLLAPSLPPARPEEDLPVRKAWLSSEVAPHLLLFHPSHSCLTACRLPSPVDLLPSCFRNCSPAPLLLPRQAAITSVLGSLGLAARSHLTLLAVCLVSEGLWRLCPPSGMSELFEGTPLSHTLLPPILKYRVSQVWYLAVPGKNFHRPLFTDFSLLQGV